MNETVWKYVLLPGQSTLAMPVGARILSVQAQRDDVCLWALVDRDTTIDEIRYFEAYPTGEPVPAPPGGKRVHRGTALMEGGALVFHVFELVHADDAATS